MSAREDILARVRSGLKTPQDDAVRRRAVQARLKKAPAGVIPARGQLGHSEQVALFCEMAAKLGMSVERLEKPQDVPKAVADYLRARNLRSSVRMGADPRLAAMPWARQKALEVRHGASDGEDETGVSHAFKGVAETGAIAVLSGPDNPYTINFLPEHHIVVVDAADIVGDFEAALGEGRARFGKGRMPRTFTFISGPSRSADVEQTIILGAHGPRALHLILVGK
jgi:L-lactate dehydrogenase complex protein LldG